MKLYRLQSGFTKNGYENIIKTYDETEYDGEYIKYFESSCITSWFHSNELNKYHKGMINSDHPCVAITTCDADKIDEYIVTIKNMIFNNLGNRLSTINEQLRVIKTV